VQSNHDDCAIHSLLGTGWRDRTNAGKIGLPDRSVELWRIELDQTLSAEQVQGLADELSRLSKTAIAALQTPAFILLTAQEADDYDKRRLRDR
jgi:hypothetical protein